MNNVIINARWRFMTDEQLLARYNVAATAWDYEKNDNLNPSEYLLENYEGVMREIFKEIERRGIHYHVTEGGTLGVLEKFTLDWE